VSSQPTVRLIDADDVEALAALGAEAVGLLIAGDIKALADRYGYMLAHGRRSGAISCSALRPSEPHGWRPTESGPGPRWASSSQRVTWLRLWSAWCLRMSAVASSSNWWS
jgi:hypothetical protein